MDLIEDLDAFVSELEHGDAERPTMDDDLANRMLRRLRRQQITAAEIKLVARAERERIEEWERARLESVAADQAGIERMLDGYMRVVEQRRKLRTLKLPNGELRLRPASTRVTIEDEDAFLEWALGRARAAALEGGDVSPAHFDAALAKLRAEPLLRTKIEPAKDAIKKATELGPQRSVHEDVELLAAVVKADDAGEVVPGVLIERSTGDAFSYSCSAAAVVDMGHDESTQGGTDDHDD